MEAAPFVLSTILALAIGLGRVRVPPRTLLLADCVLRSLTFAALGFLSVTGRLTLPGADRRPPLRRDVPDGRVEQPAPAGHVARGRAGRFAVNGLLGLNTTFALYIAGSRAWRR